MGGGVLGCWVVVCGRGGAVSCVVWSPLNKNDERQHRCRSSFVSTSLSATWHWETPALRRVDVAGTRSLGDVALSCCGSHVRG
ncbi:hypothetical protein K443DRAFT_14883 [Laccaria amethystina LaAM-08-1]|uniref:Secreted protein n=1 Tax=Laccaria amethystina LaAM-08-1 TaxID=1095629 RepID=A0A0C9WZW7_9AGAR|nr:hypothetical protein K443DRAFT_14883 [Laccaria amethystina LaAM-08-1]